MTSPWEEPGLDVERRAAAMPGLRLRREEVVEALRAAARDARAAALREAGGVCRERAARMEDPRLVICATACADDIAALAGRE